MGIRIENENISARLQRAIISFSAFTVLAVGTIIAVVTALPLYAQLRQGETQSLVHALKTREMAVEQFLAELAQTAWQVTSRTAIRDKLEEFNQGKVSRAQLAEFTRPKLEDALGLSRNAVGVARLDEKGEMVVRVGLTIPQSFWPPLQGKGEVSMRGPVFLVGGPYLVVGAPIFNREGKRVGRDLILFKLTGLQAIVRDDRGLGETGEMMLGMVDGSRTLLLFPRRGEDDRLAGQAGAAITRVIRQAAHLPPGEHGVVTPRGSSLVVAYAFIPGLDWALMVAMGSEEIYAGLNRQLLTIGMVILILLLLCTAATVLLLRPLGGKIIIHTSMLEQEIRDKNEALLRQQEAEAALRESEGNFRRIFEGMQDGYLQEDLEGNILMANPAVCRLLQYDCPNLLAHNVGREIYAQPADRLELRKMLDEKGKVQGHELLLKRRNGETIVADSNIHYLRDENGRPFAVETILRDVTQRKKYEKELQHARKMEALGTLAGGIAHDFNNILSAIYGSAELAQVQLGNPQKVEHHLKVILDSAHRAGEMVKQILTFSRQREFKPRPVRPKDIVKEALKLFEPSLPTTIELRHNIQSDSLVLADPTHIYQIVMNLCTNAYHAMEMKGGVLEVSLTDTVLDQQFATTHPAIVPGRYVRLTVSDTGHGMAGEVVEKIFDPFFTTKPEGKGTGLGLSVVHGIVEACRGAITVYSEPGKGSVFSVFLPVSIDREAEIEEIGAILPKGKGSILFVDDEEILARLGEEVLNELGYRVTARTDPVAALALFKEDPHLFDLVISDITMPRLSGVAMVREMKALNPGVAVILVTGFRADIHEESLHEIGVDKLLMKPMIVRDLAYAVQEVLGPRIAAPHQTD